MYGNESDLNRTTEITEDAENYLSVFSVVHSLRPRSGLYFGYEQTEYGLHMQPMRVSIEEVAGQMPRLRRMEQPRRRAQGQIERSDPRARVAFIRFGYSL